MGSASDKGLFANIPADELNKYNRLASDLEPYLKGATGEILESIIDDKRLPEGAEKPKWKKLTDAKRFGDYFGFTPKQLRDLFDNNIRSNNKPKGKIKLHLFCKSMWMLSKSIDNNFIKGTKNLVPFLFS